MRLVPATPLGVFNTTSISLDALPPSDFTFEMKDWQVAGLDPWRFVGDVCDPEEWSRLEKLLDELDPVTADMLNLRFKVGLVQTTIAHIFGCSQPTVNYRCQAGIAQARILLRRPQITRSQMRNLIKRGWRPPREYVSRGGLQGHNLTWEQAYQIIVIFWECRSQSETGRRIGKSQGFVRNYIRTVVANLESMGEPLTKAFAASLNEILHVKASTIRTMTYHKRVILDAA